MRGSASIMGRLSYISIASSVACVAFATAWTSGFAAGPAWLELAQTPFSKADHVASVSNYPLRLELPPLQESKLSPRAGDLLVETTEDVTADGERESVASWVFGEPRLTPVGSVASPSRSSSVPPQATQSGLLAARFDIATFGRIATEDDAEFKARKPLIVSGEKIGALELAMGQGSLVSVDRAELAKLLGGRVPALSDALTRLGTERVTFDTLRSRDIQIRYDALSDAVVIESRS